MTKWFEGKVSDIIPLSDTKRKIYIQIQDEELFDFNPGQFIVMDLPIGSRRLQRWRSYSIANTPKPENVLEFCIGKLEGGAASQYFFEEIEIGTSIKFKGPEGTFVTPKNLDRPIVMICTGTGVVPFRSMIQEIVLKDLDFKSIQLIYGCRYRDDILYRTEFEYLEANNANFKYSIVLSRQKDWEGHQGHVHRVYKKMYKNKKVDTLFMLCGWTNMIDEAITNLNSVVENPFRQIKYELYG